MEDLRVPKRRTAIEVLMIDGTFRQLEVFLSEKASDHHGAELLGDLLNKSESTFIPAFDVQTQSMTFLNRSAIRLARIGAEHELEVEDPLTPPTEFEVEMILAD